MKAIISYFDRQDLVGSAQEAISFINSLTYRNAGKGFIRANDLAVRKLNEIFSSDVWSGNAEIATTGCGNTRIYLYPALADTLTEHLDAYRAKTQEERELRIAEAKRRQAMRMNELNERREGWYYVEMNDIKIIGTFNGGNDRPIYRDFSGKFIAESGADAYRQAVKHLDDCLMNDFTSGDFTYWHHECPDMMNYRYRFVYIGAVEEDR